MVAYGFREIQLSASIRTSVIKNLNKYYLNQLKIMFTKKKCQLK